MNKRESTFSFLFQRVIYQTGQIVDVHTEHLGGKYDVQHDADVEQEMFPTHRSVSHRNSGKHADLILHPLSRVFLFFLLF